MNPVCKAVKHHQYIAGLFYYTGLGFLLFLLGAALYWQLQHDTAEFEFQKFDVTSTKENRSFYIPVNFCNSAVDKITISRQYRDTLHNIYYNVPDGEYHIGTNDCFNTRLVGNTGRLDPGVYEYRVFVKYAINPLRSEQTEVALITVTVE